MLQKNGRLKVALVGLRFGAGFPGIYADHPDVAEISICDTDPVLLAEFGDKHNVQRRFGSVEAILKCADIDAVHLITPIHSHAKLTLEVLAAGKHCACTVPMGTTLDELKAIVRAERASGKNYMMMETAVYTHHCLHARELIRNGEMGRVQFLSGAHHQDMEHWPAYWHGLPPMHYATHAVAPLLSLTGARATKVHCFGSGWMRQEMVEQYGNPYPFESALFRLDRDGLAAEVTRSLSYTAHEYAEIFTVHGVKGTFAWHMENEMPVLFTRERTAEDRPGKHGMRRIVPNDYSSLLPEPIRKYSGHVVVTDPANPHQSVLQGGAHHGSHPHMVHEFVRSIVEGRPATCDAVTAANWSAAGICAHLSAMQDGAGIDIPDFTAI